MLMMILSHQGADINCTDYKGNSPLLLATSCGAWKTVSLLLSKGEPTASTLSCSEAGLYSRTLFRGLGASVNVKDMCGCSFLHLAILQPKGLKNIPEEVLQVCSSTFPCSKSHLEKMCYQGWIRISNWSVRQAAKSSWRILFLLRSFKIFKQPT